MADTHDPDAMTHEDPRNSISDAPSFEEYLSSRKAFFIEGFQGEKAAPTKLVASRAKKAPLQKKAPAHKDGVFSPVVYWAKGLLGDEKLNNVRAKFISVHSDAIKNFVSTADSDSGTKVLKVLFDAADKNKNGKIEAEELEAALKTLGFRFLKEKQIKGIFARAGGEKGYITLEEWMEEAPKTLKTNLVKLAKTNGGDMGLLV